MYELNLYQHPVRPMINFRIIYQKIITKDAVTENILQMEKIESTIEIIKLLYLFIMLRPYFRNNHKMFHTY